MGDENERPIDDERDPAGEVYDDELDPSDPRAEPEIYEDEEDLRRRSPHE